MNDIHTFSVSSIDKKNTEVNPVEHLGTTGK